MAPRPAAAALCLRRMRRPRRSPWASPILAFRLSTSALLIAALFIFSGLFFADRSIAALERGNERADVAEAVSLGSGLIAVQHEALGAVKVLLLAGEQPDAVLATRLADVTALLPGQFRHLERIWIADTAGELRVDREVGRSDGDATGALPPLDLDTLRQLQLDRAMAEARRTGRAAFSTPGRLLSGEQGYVIVDPVLIDGELRGFVGGVATTRLLEEAVSAFTVSQGLRALYVTTHAEGGDTLVRHERGSTRGTYVQRQGMRLAGPNEWFVTAHYPTWSVLRMQLWGVALCTLAALVLVVVHERRQVARIADRSRELEHLSQELLRANRAKSEFLANVSHELRTPLNAIVGFTELLRDGVYGELGPRQSGPVQRIEASASHLRVLVDQVLDLAKIAAGRIEVHPEMIDLRQFVLDVATEIEPLLTERGLAFSLAVASVPRVRTDPGHLRQILVNLLGNAAKFTVTGGVAVRARLLTPGTARVPATLRAQIPDPGASWVALQVTDTGVGIAVRDQERVFDEFEQVNPGSRSDSDARGTGLGLPISRRLARLLGGDLTLESLPGRGSTFTLWLPVGS